MRKFIWIAIIVLLLAACQNNGDSGSNPSNPDNGSSTVAEQPEVPRIEDTPVPYGHTYSYGHAPSRP